MRRLHVAAIALAATLFGCVARTEARSPVSGQAEVYPEGPYGFFEGEVYPPLSPLRAHYDPRGERGVRAIVLVIASPTALEAMHGKASLEQQSAAKARGLHHLLALFDHATQEPLSAQALTSWSLRERPSFEVMAAAPDDVAPGLVVYPTRYVIDPRTMRIVTIAEGVASTKCDPEAETLLLGNGAPPGACDG